MLLELGIHCDYVKMYADQSVRNKTCKESKYHKRLKNIDMRFLFIRYIYERGKVDLQYIPSNEQLGDLYTKDLPKPQFYHLELN